MKSISLKTKNLPLLSCLFLWCLGLYLCALGAVPISAEVNTKFTSLQTAGRWSALGLPLLLMLISGLISSSQKEVITFWRLKHRLPACRAFSTFAQQDNRIDLKALETIASPWPNHPDDQNRTWYKLYSTIKNDPIVLHAHKMYLLGREATVLTFLFAATTPTSILLLFGMTSGFLLYSGIMVLQYVLCAVATQNFASRFVCNVLAISTSRKEPHEGSELSR